MAIETPPGADGGSENESENGDGPAGRSAGNQDTSNDTPCPLCGGDGTFHAIPTPMTCPRCAGAGTMEAVAHSRRVAGGS